MNQSVVLLMGANSQLTLVFLNSCFWGHYFHLQEKAGMGLQVSEGSEETRLILAAASRWMVL